MDASRSNTFSFKLPEQFDMSPNFDEFHYIHEEAEEAMEQYDHINMLIDEACFASMSDSDSDTQVPVQWPRTCPSCPTLLPSKQELYDHFRLLHDEHHDEDEKMTDSMTYDDGHYPEVLALSEHGESSEESFEDSILTDKLFADLWTDADNETNIALGNICSVCSFFAPTHTDLIDHFQTIHLYNPSASSALGEDEDMSDEMSDEEDLSESDAETVTPRNLQPKHAAETYRKLSETTEAVQSWLGDLQENGDESRQEEHFRTPTQMQFFRTVEVDEKDFMCGYCDREFEFLEELKAHQDEVHPLTINTAQQLVDAAEPTQGSKSHFAWLSGINIDASECQTTHLLDTQYLTLDLSNMEEVGVETDLTMATPSNRDGAKFVEVDYICDFCRRSFDSHSALMYHLYNDHTFLILR